jgi:hypothetical protein
MILDFDSEFTTSGGQVLTTTAAGTKVLDAGAARDWGAGDPVTPYIRIASTADVNKLTSITVDIENCTASGGTSPTVLSTVTILLAALLKNTVHRMPTLLAGTSKRYLRANITVTGTACDSGAKIIVGFANGSRPQDGVNYL